jgi:hypothetical protein
MKILTKLTAVAIVLAPSVASADSFQEVLVKYGASVSAGGGFVQFTEGSMRDFATEGAGWEGRLAFGTKTNLTIEAAYVGSLHAIDALGIASNANLLGTGIESNVRINLAKGNVQPYFLAGAGWGRYSLTNITTNTSDISDYDNVAQFPMGIGIGFKQGGMLIDARAVYRPTTQVDMFAGSTDSSLASWSATMRAGFEY